MKRTSPKKSSAFVAAGISLLLQSSAAFTFRQHIPRTFSPAVVDQTEGNVIALQHNHLPEYRPMSSSTVLHGWFGGGGGTDSKKDAILGTFEISGSGDSQVLFESLSDFIRNKWAVLFTDGNIKLTTPVKLDQIALSVSSEEDGVNVASGVRLLFQKVDTGYKSKEEEEREEKGETESKKKEEKDEPSQGGVEILVEQMEDGKLRVVAKRCDIDDDTMIKEMSEEKILAELQMAIDVWKKDSS